MTEKKGTHLKTTTSTFHRFHHSPAGYCSLLDGVKDQPLKSESNDANDRKAGHHNIRVEKFLGIKNHPPQPPRCRSDHLTAYHSDPRPGESLSESRDHERQRSRQDNFSKQCFLIRSHRFRR